MTVLTKALVGVGGLGTALGGGILISKSSLFSKPEIKSTWKDEIENDKWVLLTKSHASEIEKVLTAYKSNNPTVTLRFDGFTGNENNASDLLLQRCKDLYEKSYDISFKRRYS